MVTGLMLIMGLTFPVPGGPWIRVRVRDRAASTADFWLGLQVRSKRQYGIVTNRV